MKKDKTSYETMRAEYDFSKGVRGKYVDRIREGSNVVVLDPDVAELYPTSEAVNRALRAIASAAPQPQPRPKRRTKAKAIGE